MPVGGQRKHSAKRIVDAGISVVIMCIYSLFVLANLPSLWKLPSSFGNYAHNVKASFTEVCVDMIGLM